MVQFQQCTPAYHQATIALICTTFKPPMLEEFPLLLGLTNLSHMWIAIDDERIVAVVSYYTTPVQLQNVTMSVASIGAVATHPDYRGRGLSSELLKCCESLMISEGVDLVLISGDLPHYRRFGADQISTMTSYKIPPLTTPHQLLPYDEKYLPQLIQLYNQLPYRFVRTPSEMSQLIRAVLTPDPWWDTYVDLISANNQVVGYVKYAIEKGHRLAFVHEVVGSYHDALRGVHALYHRHSLDEVHWELIHNDPFVTLLNEEAYEHHTHPLHHTSKIIRFTELMDKFAPLFDQLAEGQTYHFYQQGDTFIFEFGHQSYQTESRSVAQAIVFGPLPDVLKDHPIAKEMARFFPVPFVFPNGLNYQ